MISEPPDAPREATPIEISEEMKHSFMEYSMSVIVSRALPDVRDGFKPVHRRILYGMYDAGMRPDRQRQKCANAVGNVMARFHPHGDQAIYDALVRMAQDFSLRYPLIDPKGNFGSIDFPPAAMRYTEARLNRLAMTMLDGIDEGTADFVENYDGQHSEPTVLPSRFPNLLVNGSSGIAVGMATNIPPHNLAEVIDAVIHKIDEPDAGFAEMMEHIQGPDFPTGAQIVGKRGIQQAYLTGRGSVKMRAVTDIVETRSGKTQIIATELPYQVSLQRTAEKIADLVRDGRVEGISNVADHSDRSGPRLVIDLKRDANPGVVLNNLYKHTQLQDTFGVNTVALVDGVPRTLNLVQVISHYIDHQLEVVERRTRFRLEKARARAHIVEGLLIALDSIDRVIQLIRSSVDAEAARNALISEIGVSEIQASHILDMPLRRLTGLETDKLRAELSELQKRIVELVAILGDPSKLRSVIKDELVVLRDTFGNERRTLIVPDEGEFDIEDLIADEDLVISLTREGWIKAVPRDALRTQGRGGRGVQGGRLREGDHVEHLITTTAHAYLLFFSNKGKVYRIKAHAVPIRDRTAKGVSLAQFLPVEGDERIEAIIDTRDYETARYLTMVTKNGMVKKTKFQAYDSSRRDGLIAIGLRDGDELVRVFTTSGEDDIIVATANGKAIRFDESDARPMGRTAGGVRAISLRATDFVIGAGVGHEGKDVLLVTEAGYGKRTPIADFRPQYRGGKGLVAMKLRPERGRVVGSAVVDDGDRVLFINSSGIMIRTEAWGISRQGRSATGVKLVDLNEGERITAIALEAGDPEVLEESIEIEDAPIRDSDGDDAQSTDNPTGDVDDA